MIEPQTMPKTVSEVRVYDFNFSAQPEILAGLAITSVISLTSTPVGLTVGGPTIDVTGKRVQVQLSGGTLAARYLLNCVVALASGSKRLEMAGAVVIIDFPLPSV